MTVGRERFKMAQKKYDIIYVQPLRDVVKKKQRNIE